MSHHKKKKKKIKKKKMKKELEYLQPKPQYKVPKYIIPQESLHAEDENPQNNKYRSYSPR